MSIDYGILALRDSILIYAGPDARNAEFWGEVSYEVCADGIATFPSDAPKTITIASGTETLVAQWASKTYTRRITGLDYGLPADTGWIMQ